jgi:hypothetical protein
MLVEDDVLFLCGHHICRQSKPSVFGLRRCCEVLFIPFGSNMRLSQMNTFELVEYIHAQFHTKYTNFHHCIGLLGITSYLSRSDNDNDSNGSSHV